MPRFIDSFSQAGERKSTFPLEVRNTAASIRNSVSIVHENHECVLLENFFSHAITLRIIHFFKDRSILNWQRVPQQEHLSRLSIDKSESSTFQEVDFLFRHPHIVLALESKLKVRLVPVGISFWKDEAGYEIGMHVDNHSFNCAIQIYITEQTLLNLGTSISFGDGSEPSITLPYRNGSGYLLKSANHTYHGLLTPIPNGIERYSVYARYRIV